DWSPDANSTMRMTFGKVGSYEPKDGVTYNYYTTLDGVMQKEDATNPEFEVPQRLKDLYNAKDYGQYADANGKLPVGLITDNDITGGNSGSPLINGKGELIGVAFDGNWEAMSGDIFFEDELQRTISVDIRYVLFIVDKYAGARHLVDEMTLHF
ncbi:MAG: serine protease, partial [Flavobacteriia bacterium]|nr:serine protease [Flavobacteriia bacterium]